MQTLIDDGELQSLHSRLAQRQGADRLATSIELAWHLRQRDTALQARGWR